MLKHDKEDSSYRIKTSVNHFNSYEIYIATTIESVTILTYYTNLKSVEVIIIN